MPFVVSNSFLKVPPDPSSGVASSAARHNKTRPKIRQSTNTQKTTNTIRREDKDKNKEKGKSKGKGKDNNNNGNGNDKAKAKYDKTITRRMYLSTGTPAAVLSFVEEPGELGVKGG